MPPKAKITRDMIVCAGMEVVRKGGAECLNVRRVAAELDCSTQPIMYHFKTVDELKSAVYSAADAFHSGFIMTTDEPQTDPFLAIGLRYIRFAAEETNLFRFLFQSDKLGSTSFSQLLESSEISPIIAPLTAATGLSEDKAQEIFSVLFICVHGAASLIANNSIGYDREYFENMLTRTFNGLIAASQEENHETF